MATRLPSASSWRYTFLAVLLAAFQSAGAQTSAGFALPAELGRLGITSAPPVTPNLKLKAPHFVSSEKVSLQVETTGMDAKQVVIFTVADAGKGDATLVADIQRESPTPDVVTLSARLQPGVSLVVALVLTPQGWMRTEAIVHRGRRA